MNDIKLMNRAADNIRILAASMVEKAKSGHPGGAMGGADFVIRKIHYGKAATAFSLTRDTCLRCCIPYWHWQASFQLKN